MTWQYIPVAIPMVLSATISAGLAYFGWVRPPFAQHSAVFRAHGRSHDLVFELCLQLAAGNYPSEFLRPD